MTANGLNAKRQECFNKDALHPYLLFEFRVSSDALRPLEHHVGPHPLYRQSFSLNSIRLKSISRRSSLSID